MHMKLLDPQNLSKGSERQKAAFRAIEKLEIFTLLKSYSPVLAGTIALGVDLPTSDLDIICASENLEEFAAKLKAHFGDQPGFRIRHKVISGMPSVVCRFKGPEEFPIEIFGQNQSVFRQSAVLHLLIEARLLSFAAAGARERIRQLKAAGRSTEEAFADCFALSGDPYEALLKIANLADHEILNIAHRFLFEPN